MMTRMCRCWGRLRLVAAALAAAACAAPSAFAQCSYEVAAIIQAPPCPIVGPPVTRGHGMNSLGHVCGSYAQCWVTADEAFYWTPETGFHTIPRLPGMLSSYATGINDHGIVCGYMTTGIDVGDRAWVYDTKTGEMMFLEPLHGVGNSYANAINNSNIVVGSRSISTSGANPYNAVIWRPFEKGSPVQDLGVMNGPNSWAAGGNAGPDGAGWAGTGVTTANCRAYLWLVGKPVFMGLLSNTINSSANAMNNMGQAIGSCRTTPTGPFITFRWMSGEMIHHQPPKSYQTSGAASMNDAGQIVGSMRPTEVSTHDAYLWQHGYFHNLNIIAQGSPSNLHMYVAAAVNGLGNILAHGTLNSKVVAVVLTPINQPLTDLNHDCATNTHDLLILLEQWGPTPTNATGGVPIADFNGDGRVDVLDLLILLGNWG
ncbi:MAG TPA: DUF3466 family protein [Phycisphaerales bacterium]|nr:DUF3466 family protein [Phycisphaerales bacterium]